MTEERTRRVEVIAAPWGDGSKIHISLTADAGMFSQTDTLPVTRGEAYEIVEALSAFLASDSGSDT